MAVLKVVLADSPDDLQAQPESKAGLEIDASAMPREVRYEELAAAYPAPSMARSMASVHAGLTDASNHMAQKP